MKNFTEIMSDLKRESINSPIIHQCFEMQRVNNLQINHTLAAMALSLAEALKESQEKHRDAEMRAWPRAIMEMSFLPGRRTTYGKKQTDGSE